MTVSATPAKAGPYTGNDSASAFAFSFKVFAASDIRVVETLIATEAEADLVLNTNYTVVLNNDQDVNPGGTITYKVGGVTTALPSTKKLTIVGDFTYEQPTDLPDGGAYRASVVENALDRNTMLVKQTQEEVARAVKVPVSSDTDPDDLLAQLTADAAAAAASAAEAAATYDAFDDRYLGSKADDPTTDNDGDALIEGALYWNTTTNAMRAYDGAAWQEIGGAAYTVVNAVGDGVETDFPLPFAPVSKNNVDAFFDAAYQQKSGYSVAGTTLSFSVAPPNGVDIEFVIAQVLPVNSADAANVTFTPAGDGAVQTDAAKKLREFLTPEDYGTTGASDDRVVLQKAIDAHAALGVRLRFPAKTYLIGSALRFPSNCSFEFAGIDKTIFKLNDTADEDSNVWEPYAFDGSVENCVFIGGFTVDGNYSRGTVSGVGTSRPGASGFITGGAKNVHIVGGIKAVDCVLHGIDICNGGEDDGGTLAYVTAAHEAVDYYPANESQYIYIDKAIAENCGDDGVTGHYSKDVQIDYVHVPSTGQRHPSPDASNCFEIDDGCRDWTVGDVVGRGGIRAVAIKCHSPEPSPMNITIGNIDARGCRGGVWIDDAGWTSGAPRVCAKRIHLGDIIVSEPASINGATTEPISALRINSYDEVQFGNVIAEADGDEVFTFSSAVAFTSGATNITGGTVIARNWAYANTSVNTTGALQISSTVSHWHLDGLIAHSCGYRGIADFGSTHGHVGFIDLHGDSLSGAIGVRSPVSLLTSGHTWGPMNITGYTTTTSYDTETRSNPSSVMHGLQVIGGMMNIGQSVTKTIASGSLTIGDSSYVRVAGEGGVADDLVTITGGKEGDLLSVRAASSTVDIVVKHGTGNIYLSGTADFTLTHAFDTLTLICASSGDWVEIGRGNNLA